MKKVTRLCTLAAVISVSVLGLRSASGGLLIDVAACNDFYFEFAPTADSDIFSINGYEHGCGQADRQGTGTIYLSGGFAFIAVNNINGSGSTGGIADCGQNGHQHYVIDLSSFAGPYDFQYLYLVAGVASGHCGFGSATISFGPNPLGVTASDDVDAAIGQ